MNEGSDQRARLAAESLLIDHWTAEAVTALHAGSVRPILLKGPAVARWLYADDPAARGYADIDLLVAPLQMEAARTVLRGLGYEAPPHIWVDGDVPAHDGAWTRTADGAVVDLHHTVHGCELLPDEVVWRALSAGTQTMTVGDGQVTVLGLPARALHVVLHMEATYGPGSKPWSDLARALASVDVDVWREAAGVARRLGIEAEMGAKLRRLDAGALLAEQLDLPTSPSPRLAFFGLTSDQQALARLAVLDGWPAKLRYVRGKLLPPPAYLRQVTSPRAPLADRGAVGLVAAYASRVGHAVAVAATGTARWARSRRG